MKLWSEEYKKKTIDPQDIESTCLELRSRGKTIATLNGSFDLLHSGHLQIIYEASLLADVLIVCLNSDASIQQYKSPSRPIIPLQYRLQMMAALEFVDYVTTFQETTPLHILELIKPNIHVNGAEYGKDCLEAETVLRNGGAIHIVNLVPGLSTSNIIDKIKTLSESS